MQIRKYTFNLDFSNKDKQNLKKEINASQKNQPLQGNRIEEEQKIELAKRVKVLKTLQNIVT